MIDQSIFNANTYYVTNSYSVYEYVIYVILINQRYFFFYLLNIYKMCKQIYIYNNFDSIIVKTTVKLPTSYNLHIIHLSKHYTCDVQYTAHMLRIFRNPDFLYTFVFSHTSFTKCGDTF